MGVAIIYIRKAAGSIMHAVVVLLFVVAAAGVPFGGTFVSWSLDTCRTDAACATRFRLPRTDADIDAYDVARFGEMLAMSLARQQNGGDELFMANVLAPCMDDASGPGCATVQWMWMMMLRQAEFGCSPNQEWILGHGCECTDGKKCTDNCLQVAIDNQWPLTLAVGIIGVFMCAFVVWDMRQSNEVARLSAQHHNESVAAYYTLSAQLYVANEALLPPPPFFASPAAAPAFTI